MKRLAVPLRSYSQSKRAERPAFIGIGPRVSAWSCFEVSSTQTSGRSATVRSASGGARRGLSRHAASAVLGAQDHQRLEQSRTLGADQHEEGSERGLLGAEPGCGRNGDRRLRREILSEYDTAVEYLTKDHEALLALYEFPAEQ
jgi:hypothetical protein